MPTVKGKKYPYTTAGRKAAAGAKENPKPRWVRVSGDPTQVAMYSVR